MLEITGIHEFGEQGQGAIECASMSVTILICLML